MNKVTSLDSLHTAPAVLAIGAFDGIHLGHRALLQGAVAQARAAQCPCVVVTFYPHPRAALRGIPPQFYLTSPAQKESLLADLGCTDLITIPFTSELAAMPAPAFLAQLQQATHFHTLWAGSSFTLGNNRQGTLDWLRGYGAAHGFRVVEQPPHLLGESWITSTRIRTALQSGNLAEANACLGRAYQLQGEVVHGAQRGRTINFPTANLAVWEQLVLPSTGVYLCRARWRAREAIAVTNIGYRPTVAMDSPTPTVEAHLLDVDEDLYGEWMTLDLVTFLRAERRFATLEDLRGQIQRDVDEARAAWEEQRFGLRG